MSLITHPASIWLRNLLRKYGLLGPVRTLFGRKGYEEKVESALLSAVRPDDVVWDVGANVGHYTRKMATRVSAGSVFAFEPSPSNFKRLQAACSGLANVHCFAIGLSASPGTIRFIEGADNLGATSRIAHPNEGAAECIDVEVCSGDDLIASGRVRAPNVVKIDVEGHEIEVLKGLINTISGPFLRDCIVEVHFGLLAQSGAPHAPAEIARTFDEAGFRLRWVDASHLHATKLE